jgi:hypothetical protein
MRRPKMRNRKMRLPGAISWSAMIFPRIAIPLYVFVVHDLFRKPVPAFRDHTLSLHGSL